MSLHAMKEELHQRLWAAQERGLALRQTGATKHELKTAGRMRTLLLWGKTRVDYERGREWNVDIDKRDMRDYLARLIEGDAKASYVEKVKSAIVKFGAVYGKYESFRSTGRKIATVIRERAGGPQHQRITREIARTAVARLRDLDDRFEIRTGLPRGYHLAAELQSRCGLRAEEATERMTRDRLAGNVIGKGGREREVELPQDLRDRLRAFFETTDAAVLAPLRAYESAVRRAVKAVGGRATGTHALRRLWADAFNGEQYSHHLARGLSPALASKQALADVLEALGHGRDRSELRRAYLRAA